MEMQTYNDKSNKKQLSVYILYLSFFSISPN
jgi:hypothetical protein